MNNKTDMKKIPTLSEKDMKESMEFRKRESQTTTGVLSTEKNEESPMNEWIVRYEQDEVFNELEKLGTIIHKAKIMNLVVIQTTATKETIQQIKGVRYCMEPVVGTLCDEEAEKGLLEI